MNIEDRVLEALSWGTPDLVPWVPKANHVPRDPSILNRLRKLGMGLAVNVKVFSVRTPNVSVEQSMSEEYLVTTFSTPLGKASQMTRINLPTEGGERDLPWITEHLIKEDKDYEIVKFIVEDQVFESDYDEAVSKIEDLDGSGIVYTNVGYTPLMQLIVNFMGFQKFAFEFYRNREKIEELISTIGEKLEECSRVVAESPVKIVSIGDNIDGVLVSPKLFSEYCIPYYRKYSEILHSRGKLTMSHMDGRLRTLKALMPKTGLDVIEAFTPPPIGDLTVKEARNAWEKNLALWVNIPESIFYNGPEEIEKFIRSLLKEASPGDGIVLGITETVPPSRRDTVLELITKTVNRYGKYPISPN